VRPFVSAEASGTLSWLTAMVSSFAAGIRGAPAFCLVSSTLTA
jgi:hypothetical protein